MKVLKFGGKSMRDAFKNVKEITSEAAERDGSVVAVVSAFKEVTDSLLKLSDLARGGKEKEVNAEFESLKKMHLGIVNENTLEKEYQAAATSQVEALFVEIREKLDDCLSPEKPFLKTRDHIAGFGERLSGLVLNASLQSEGQDSEMIDARELVKTNANYSNAEVDTQQTYKLIAQRLGSTRKKISVVTGFIGSAADGSTTTLGRGGSDYTAALFAAALKSNGATVEEIQVWKETNGVESADPNIVHGTKTIPHLSYDEMGELAGAGAKVLYRPAVHPAEEQHIPLRVLNTFSRTHPGTLIDDQKNGDTEAVKAVSSVRDVTIIKVEGSGLHAGPGIAGRVFDSTAKAGANVLMISQAVSENSICFAVSKTQAEKAKAELFKAFTKEMEAGAVSVELEPDHVIIAAVGENMRGHPGVASRLFSTLNKSGVSAHMIAQGANELNISVAISKKDLRKALQVVHDEFILSDRKIVNLYIVGPGRVGKEALKRMSALKEAHLKNNGLEFRLAGVINSSRMLMTTNGGVPFEEWEQQLSAGEEADLKKFVDYIFESNLPHSMFVDCTASAAPVQYYQDLLQKSVAIVTPNKKALSGSMNQYQAIRKAAKTGNTLIGIETNVGAALPVIGPLRDAITGGDVVQRIDGMLSGTLGFIFSNFDGSKPFSEVVREAYEKGYTEPNPADDLNLSDVARKIVILARETGAEIELDDVQITPLLSEECRKARDTEEFFAELKKMDAHFAELYRIAVAEVTRLRVIERFENGKASIQLLMVDPEHPAYHLKGTKNLVEYTTRDHPSGWQVSGAGAGIDVTASGVIADMVKAARHS